MEGPYCKPLLAVFIILLQTIFGNCEVQVLRPIGKAKIQPLSLSVIQRETQFKIHCLFKGPSDTESRSPIKVLDIQKDFTLFEAIIPVRNVTNHKLILKSKSTSETLKMALNFFPTRYAQFEFYGSNCEFEVKGSTDKSKYSAIVKNCGAEEDYTMYQYFKAKLNLSDEIVSVTSFPESEKYWKYVNVSESYEPEDTATAILNKDLMAEDGVKVRNLDFDVFALGHRPPQRRKMCESLVWTFSLI
ncbi:uncharacterized protein LOC134273806 [Saccostrea cucullata]|uniref:uncharacterized protein LOC134273806 n=1 Tax=Saccostrea cuccullata TaxID=36930 RepID=UPI002ED54D37